MTSEFIIRHRGFSKITTPIGNGTGRQVSISSATCNNRTLIHLIQAVGSSMGKGVMIGVEGLRAQFVVPSRSLQHLNGCDQRLPNALLPDPEFTERRNEVLRCFTDMRRSGGEAMLQFVIDHPTTSFFSDASNFPLNEGYFVIQEGKILPLPTGSFLIKGKQRVLAIDKNGKISFPIVDTEDPGAIASANSGFSVPQIIHDGKQIGLLDEMPGTGQSLISALRGHIGQIFDQDKYSGPNSLERAKIHGSLLESLRKTRREKDVFVAGRILNFPLASYNHTYWIETVEDQILCAKTYSKGQGQLWSGVTFSDTYVFLRAIAKSYNFHIKNAYIGCGGKTVRIVANEKGQPVPIRYEIVDSDIGTHFDDQPLANFLAFYWE